MTRSPFVLLLVVATACGGDNKPSPAAPAPSTAQPRTAAELGPMCDRYYARQRSCADDYLRALVSMRAEYDMPEGIAAEVKEIGLDAAVAKAKVEWTQDTTVEKTAAICKAMAERTPPERVEQLLSEGEGCEATTDCAAYATCAINTERAYVRSGRQH